MNRFATRTSRWVLSGIALLAIVPGAIGAQPKSGEMTIYSFHGDPDGVHPYAGIIRDKLGNLYGTTINGGENCGTVFKIDSTGNETVLYAFDSSGANGCEPYGQLVIDKAGNLYGTTYLGGNFAAGDCAHNGCGTVFKIAPDGTESVLYAFQGIPQGEESGDGALPMGGLVMDRHGNLYGTNQAGGSTNCPYSFSGCGTVFRISAAGSEKILYAFCAQGGNCTDGIVPEGQLLVDGAGNLFGTTQSAGGVPNCGSDQIGCGTIFEIPKGGGYEVLYSFCNVTGAQDCPDGASPGAGLIEDASGNLYGTTGGGGSAGDGTVFELTTNGNESVLYNFVGPPADGSVPQAGLTMDTAGNLYGTTTAGGDGAFCTSTCGTVFKIAPDGSESVLYSFCSQSNCTDGMTPFGTLFARGTTLYGTARYGGSSSCQFGCGTVFRLKE